MSAHIEPCDVETNGGDCSCAETWKARAEKAEDAAATLMNQSTSLVYKTRRLEAVIRMLLDSAGPFPSEHPTMWKAWREAEALLSIPVAKSKTHAAGKKLEAELLPMLTDASKAGDKVFTNMFGTVTLVRPMRGGGWEVQDRTEQFLFLTPDDFALTLDDAIEIRRILAERRSAKATAEEKKR
jgi:hypothetical protein